MSPQVKPASIKDPFVRFEKQYPFYRMHVEAFRQKIYSYGKDNISIEELANRFDDEMWNDQFKPGTDVYKLLKSLPGTEGEILDINTLLILGILWCQGDNEDKARGLFELLNPPGQRQDKIAAGDKEWDLVFDRIVYISTYFTYNSAKEMYGPNVMDHYKKITNKDEMYDEEYTKRAIAAFRCCEEDDPQGFIMLVFGYESSMTREEF